ncbi:hypothetical protein HK096_000883, partial [Nowakowskiella sp. JEL0078]
MSYRAFYFICINVLLDNYVYWFITCFLGGYAPPDMFFNQLDQRPTQIGITENELRTLKTFEYKAIVPAVPSVPATVPTASSKSMKSDFPVRSKSKASQRLVKQVGLSHSVSLRSSSERRKLRHSEPPSFTAMSSTQASNLGRSQSLHDATASLTAARAAAMRVQLLTDNSVLSTLATGNFVGFSTNRSLSLRLSRNTSTRSINRRISALSSPPPPPALTPLHRLTRNNSLLDRANASTSNIEMAKLTRQKSTASSRSILSTRSFLSFTLPQEIPEEVEISESSDSVICAICVCEYENGEVVRMLACGHCFHMECVDVWLIGDPKSGMSGHRTCPLCA